MLYSLGVRDSRLEQCSYIVTSQALRIPFLRIFSPRRFNGLSASSLVERYLYSNLRASSYSIGPPRCPILILLRWRSNMLKLKLRVAKRHECRPGGLASYILLSARASFLLSSSPSDGNDIPHHRPATLFFLSLDIVNHIRYFASTVILF